MEGSADRINDLPDSLLLQILSLLPTKKVVATSLFSKTWRPLLLSLPALYLSSGEFKSFSFFYQFVDKVLELVDLKYVKNFVLDGRQNNKNYKYFRGSKASKWINTVIISSKVEYLELDMEPCDACELPSSVFIANNIRVLKVRGVRVPTLSHVNLPLLEVLDLEAVQFSDLTSLEMLLNSCPLLKDLAIRHPYGKNYHDPLKIGRLNHLVTAEVPPSLIPLEALSNATFLVFIKEDIRPFKFSDDIPTFNNVKHLKCVADEWTEMVNCLRSFPKLQKLVLYELGSSSPPEPILDIPPCVSLHLKEFTLLRSKGSESEFELLKFMMKNARVLKTFHTSYMSFSCFEPREFRDFAEYLRLGSESRRNEQPLVLMLASSSIPQ